MGRAVQRSSVIVDAKLCHRQFPGQTAKLDFVGDGAVDACCPTKTAHFVVLRVWITVVAPAQHDRHRQRGKINERQRYLLTQLNSVFFLDTL